LGDNRRGAQTLPNWNFGDNELGLGRGERLQTLTTLNGDSDIVVDKTFNP